MLELAMNIIKEFEGFKPRAYEDLGGVWTIGFGRTGGVKPNDTTTEEQETEWLTKEIDRLANEIKKLVKVKLTDYQLAALVSFCYNVGIGNFRKSTLLRMLNKGYYEQIPRQLTRWCKVGGQEIGGLKRRRIAESAMWDNKQGES